MTEITGITPAGVALLDSSLPIERRAMPADVVQCDAQPGKPAVLPRGAVHLDDPKQVRGDAAGLQKLVGTIGQLAGQLDGVGTAIVAQAKELIKVGVMSFADMLASLGPILSKIKDSQTTLQLEDIKRVELQNKEQMEKNDKNLTTSLEANTKAQKSGLAGRIFGWIGAAFAVVAGAVMCATGVGAAAGALMIAGGVIGLVSCALQECAKAGLISKEVMAVLGPVMTAIEVVVGLASAVVTFGGGAAGMIGKFAAKVAPKVAEMAEKVSTVLKGVAQIGARAGSASGAMAQGVLQGAGLVVDTGNTVTQTVDGALNADATFKRADLTQSRKELKAMQQLQERLGESLQQILDVFQRIFAALQQAVNAEQQTIHNLASLPRNA
ncbi:type III secretion system translocon subunit SctE [Pseudomonas entomophila]|uniref:type III secretion system translocon subunit SctE n=1 Tax=Pseudomonas entomophila TaxID=312306 RepID=UPI001F010214|nr:type III secretion system translocon subunit SctE [Pseudomonas entomophila]MCG8291448.1 type III secretion system translocon subunit SctE [Pseudomonas entomophila]